MPKRRDPSPTRPSRAADEAEPRPERAAVERALEQVVERLAPKPPGSKPLGAKPFGAKPAGKGKPRAQR